MSVMSKRLPGDPLETDFRRPEEPQEEQGDAPVTGAFEYPAAQNQ